MPPLTFAGGGGGLAGDDPQFAAVELTGCGSVTGTTVGATFDATTAATPLGTHTQRPAQCAPVTIAVTLADGRVAKLRGDRVLTTATA